MAQTATKVEINTSGLEKSVQELVQVAQTNLQAATQNASTSAAGAVTVRSPKLEFKPFDGNVLKFTEFWDLFTATIHSNAKLSDVEKLAYLKHNVTGVAAEAIAGLTLTNQNYTVARDLLKERFGQEQAILTAHYRSLVDLPRANNNAQGLLAFYNDVETNVRSLEAAGKNVQQELLVPLITAKLPKSVLVQLEIGKTTGAWCVTTLRKALSAYITAREAADQMSGETTKPDQDHYKQRPSRTMNSAGPSHTHNGSEAASYSREGGMPTPQLGTSLFANGGNARPNKPLRCWFCAGKHFTDECNKYCTVKERTEKIGNRCHVCFKEGHKAESCPDPWQCFHCKKRSHHRSICPVKFPNSTVQGSSMVACDNVMVEQGQRILQCAQACFTRDKGGNTTLGHMMFDTGSTRTFITAEL